MAQIELISDVFVNMLEHHHWIDIPSAKIQHTWKNNCIGDQSLARRLDHFLIKESFNAHQPCIRQWIGTGGISDHRPIYMVLDDSSHKIKDPFKFNSTWLRDPSYIKLITDFWQSHPISEEEDLASGFVHNLKELKDNSREWVHKKREHDDINLRQFVHAISAIEENSEGTFTSLEKKEHITFLIKQRSQILKEREESWRLRSRVIWLHEGDENTKFYHKLANG